jgi:Zn-dependent protease with chaperone function
MTTTAGTALYFDGHTTARHDVRVELTPAVIRILSPEGAVLAEWPHDEIEPLSAPDNILRIGKRNNPSLARLEVHDAQLAAAIDDLSVPVDRTGLTERRSRHKVIGWSIAATVSLLLMAVFGVPEIANRLAPFMPYGFDRKLGEAVDVQVRSSLSSGFECGQAEAQKPGRAAFDKMVGQLERAAELPFPLRVIVIRNSDANAFALPGGYIYVHQGLVEKSERPDELAGVIAHEIGHVANRDGTRSALQAAGLSFLFGMMLGDFVGGGAVILATNAILKNSYSRDVEADADAYGVRLMTKAGGDPRALGTILQRIAGTHSGMKILLDHPETEDRVTAINLMSPAGPVRPLLDPKEWAALQRICAQS